MNIFGQQGIVLAYLQNIHIYRALRSIKDLTGLEWPYRGSPAAACPWGREHHSHPLLRHIIGVPAFWLLFLPTGPPWAHLAPATWAPLAMLGVLDGPCCQPPALPPVLRPCTTLPGWWGHCPYWCHPWLLPHLPLASRQPSLLPDTNTFLTSMIVVKE